MKKTVLSTAAILLCSAIAIATLSFAMEIQVKSAEEDCISYNPNELQIVQFGDKGWHLREGRSHWMLLLDNPDDAAAALEVAKQHTQLCFIGRGNKRKNRKDYIVSYWK